MIVTFRCVFLCGRNVCIRTLTLGNRNEFRAFSEMFPGFIGGSVDRTQTVVIYGEAEQRQLLKFT